MPRLSALPCFVLTVAAFCYAQDACYGQTSQASVSAKEFGAKGDGRTDDTAVLQRAFDSACRASPAPKLHLPAGTFRITRPLVARCAMTIAGEGSARSILLQGVHATLNHGISTSFSLRLEDMGIVTSPLTRNFGMVAVISAPLPGQNASRGSTLTFLRFHSSGFNFGLDLNGGGDDDLLSAIVVRDSAISVSTEANAVSNPINAANAEYLDIEQSTLTGDQKDDHAIYAIGIRKVLIQNNLIQDHDNSAIKLLAGGFGPTAACPAGHDYSSWTIRNNIIRHSKLAVAAYTYCAVELPTIIIGQNQIEDIPDTYAGDAAAVYIQANCQSVIGKVSMSGNIFRDIGLSGVFLLSSVQSSKPCVDTLSKGTIRAFKSTGDTYINWSMSYPGDYSAISSSGANLLSASVVEMRVYGQTNGRSPLNLSAFRQTSVEGLLEIQ